MLITTGVHAQNRLRQLTLGEFKSEQLGQVVKIGLVAFGEAINNEDHWVEVQREFNGSLGMEKMLEEFGKIDLSLSVTNVDKARITFFAVAWNRYYTNVFFGATNDVSFELVKETGEYVLPPIFITLEVTEKFQIFFEKPVELAHIEIPGNPTPVPVDINSHGVMFPDVYRGSDGIFTVKYQDGTFDTWRIRTGRRINPLEAVPDIHLNAADWLIPPVLMDRIEALVEADSIEDIVIERGNGGSDPIEIPLMVVSDDPERPVRSYRIKSFTAAGITPFGDEWIDIMKKVILPPASVSHLIFSGREPGRF